MNTSTHRRCVALVQQLINRLPLRRVHMGRKAILRYASTGGSILDRLPPSLHHSTHTPHHMSPYAIPPPATPSASQAPTSLLPTLPNFLHHHSLLLPSSAVLPAQLSTHPILAVHSHALLLYQPSHQPLCASLAVTTVTSAVTAALMVGAP